MASYKEEIILCEDKLQPTWTVTTQLYRLQNDRRATLDADYTPSSQLFFNL